MMQKPATISSIANELNITPATVSRALQDHPGISYSTKQSVLKVAINLTIKETGLPLLYVPAKHI